MRVVIYMRAYLSLPVTVFIGILNIFQNVGQGLGCDCNATVVGSIPTGTNKLLFINIFISSV